MFSVTYSRSSHTCAGTRTPCRPCARRTRHTHTHTRSRWFAKSAFKIKIGIPEPVFPVVVFGKPRIFLCRRFRKHFSDRTHFTYSMKYYFHVDDGRVNAIRSAQTAAGLKTRTDLLSRLWRGEGAARISVLRKVGISRTRFSSLQTSLTPARPSRADIDSVWCVPAGRWRSPPRTSDNALRAHAPSGFSPVVYLFFETHIIFSLLPLPMFSRPVPYNHHHPSLRLCRRSISSANRRRRRRTFQTPPRFAGDEMRSGSTTRQ